MQMNALSFVSGPKLPLLCMLAVLSAHASVFAKEVVLEDDHVLARFDEGSGALTRLENKSSGWVIERRPELGSSFRLLAPLLGWRDNFVLGKDQRAVEVSKVSEHEVRIRWQNLVSEHGGVLPMELTAAVRLTNDSLVFSATLKNNCHHGPALYNFAPGHGYPSPGFLYGGDLPMAARLRAAADQVSRDFLFSGERPQDWLVQYYPISETGISAVPICQYIDSRMHLLAGVSGFDDRETLNLILMLHYIIQYEPYYYKGHLSDFPLTLAYGQRIDALRSRYKTYLWDSTFRDTLGAKVATSGSSRYSVFVTAEGKRAVVVINLEFNRAIKVKVELLQASRLLVATPEQPEGQKTTGNLDIPARCAAVVLEP